MNAWFERATGLWLMAPEWFAFGLVVAALVLWRARRRDREAPSVPTAALQLLLAGGASPVGLATRCLPLVAVVRTLGFVALALALARPVERTAEPLEARGRDLVLVIDVSSSMAARDLDAERSRLAVAQAAAADFVRARPDDRIALVSFARFPDVAVPPTLDHAALLEALARLELVKSDADEDVTGLGLALARAVELRGAASEDTRVVVLLSDGMENVADGGRGEIAPDEAARLARARGVRVHSVAVGALDETGAALEARDLERIASHTGGTFRRVEDAAGLTQVYTDIDRLEPASWSAPRVTTRERFIGFAAFGLVLLACARLLRDGPLEVLP